jgi:hypothetical protein
VKNPTLPHCSRLELALPDLEMIYRAHPAIDDVAVFVDQLGQLVVLAVSDDDEPRVRCALDAMASAERFDLPRIADLVALPARDPLRAVLFPLIGAPRRDLIWMFLVGSIATLTKAGTRLCLSCRHPLRTPNTPDTQPCDHTHSPRGASDVELD